MRDPLETDPAVIRPLTAKDLDQMMVIEESCFSDPWSKKVFEEDMDNSLSSWYGAFKGSRLAAYIGFWSVAGEGQINNIATHPDFRRQGIARRLIQAAFEEGSRKGISAWTLEVRVSNQAAIALYEQEGFRSAGIRPAYYSDPVEDAYIMWKGIRF